MIISDKYRFVFIHIPKCAGTYVRSTIRFYDDMQGKFENKDDYHPLIGNFDSAHLPLSILEKVFPVEYQKVLNYKSFAIIRHPYDRFFSSFSQYIRHTTAKDIKSLSRKDLFRYLDIVFDWLEKHINESLYPPDFIHFTPQINYVKNRGAIIVKNIFKIEEVDKLFDILSDIVGEKIIIPPQKANTSRIYKNHLYFLLIEPFRSLAQSFLTKENYLDIKKGLEKFSPFIFDSNYLRLFNDSVVIKDSIQDLYKNDYELYETRF